MGQSLAISVRTSAPSNTVSKAISKTRLDHLRQIRGLRFQEDRQGSKFESLEDPDRVVVAA